MITSIQPLLARHFNLTVELPLKSIVAGYHYAVVHNSSMRTANTGISKFKIREMGSRYFFIVLYCFLEKNLGRADLWSSPQMRKNYELTVWRIADNLVV